MENATFYYSLDKYKTNLTGREINNVMNKLTIQKKCMEGVAFKGSGMVLLKIIIILKTFLITSNGERLIV